MPAPLPPDRRLPVVLAWFGALVLLCAWLYLLFTHPLVTGIGSAALIAMGWWATRREAQRLRLLAASRRDASICEFARSFDARHVDPLIIRSVYEQLQCIVQRHAPDFPVCASDRLKDELGIDDEDLDVNLAPALARLTGRPLAAMDANPLYGKVKTVADLVHFFNAQPEADAAAGQFAGRRA